MNSKFTVDKVRNNVLDTTNAQGKHVERATTLLEDNRIAGDMGIDR
jgi:hypothetical protein